jgi:hypothetical protein
LKIIFQTLLLPERNGLRACLSTTTKLEVYTVDIGVENVYYEWLMIITAGLWVFHLLRGIRGRQYPWISFCLTAAISVILMYFPLLLRDFLGLPRDFWTTNPTLKSLNALFVAHYCFMLALLPLEGLVAIVWVIRRRFRRTQTEVN